MLSRHAINTLKLHQSYDEKQSVRLFPTTIKHSHLIDKDRRIADELRSYKRSICMLEHVTNLVFAQDNNPIRSLEISNFQ